MCTIKKIVDKEEKARIADEILHMLPDWFGIEESTQEYIRESKSMPFLGAYEDETAVGFLAIKEASPYAAEIYVMGIQPQYHRSGIGKQLFDACYQWCREHNIEYLQVKTLDYSNGDTYYAKTRCFYESMGFRPMECFKTLWDEWNPCLIMIQAIR
ncbi:MAG: GNAT family N-acetyltransferase [Clostridiales bacterium]|nr:GNAT family N-acetyltransferase [Clostridiales bacterium]